MFYASETVQDYLGLAQVNTYCQQFFLISMYRSFLPRPPPQRKGVRQIKKKYVAAYLKIRELP